MTSELTPLFPPPLRDRVHADLGKCLLVYQALETLLKLYLPHVRATESEALKNKDVDWRELLDSKRTLGSLAKVLLERTKIEPRESFEQGMKLLVDQRNEIIHHFNERPFAALSTDTECQQALEYLRIRRNFASKWLEVFKTISVGILEIDPDPTQTH